MRTEALANVCSLIVDCPHKTAPVSETPFAYAVGTTAIGDEGGIDFQHARAVDADTYEAWVTRAVPEAGDLILCREAPVGRVALVPREPRVCLGQRTVLLRPDPDVADGRWLSYRLRAPSTQTALLTQAEGSTVVHLNVSDVRTFPIDVPPLPEQRAIASVLGALDDKIESNRRLASGLAVVALALGAQASRSAVAAISVREIAEQIRVAGDSAQPYVGLDLMPKGSTILQNWNRGEGPSGHSWAFGQGDVLFGKLRPYFRKVAVAPVSGRCSREILVLRPSRPEYYGLLVATIASKPFIDYCTAISTGTKMPRAEWKDASNFQVGLPPAKVLAELADVTRRNYGLAINLARESLTLTAIRDALLPKLVSGQIGVPLSRDPGVRVGAVAEALDP